MSNNREIANLLLKLNAVQLNPSSPFTYSSGIQSPIYCDNRVTISHPKARNTIINAFIKEIKSSHCEFDYVAGTATAGIPHAAWIAHELEKPLIYVRSSPKKHGKGNIIEGDTSLGHSSILIEDLVSGGGSAISAANALKAQGINTTHCFTIFSYQLEKSKQAFLKHQLECHPLCHLDLLLDEALASNLVSPKEMELIVRWQQSPEKWLDHETS